MVCLLFEEDLHLLLLLPRFSLTSSDMILIIHHTSILISFAAHAVSRILPALARLPAAHRTAAFCACACRLRIYLRCGLILCILFFPRLCAVPTTPAVALHLLFRACLCVSPQQFHARITPCHRMPACLVTPRVCAATRVCVPFYLLPYTASLYTLPASLPATTHTGWLPLVPY